DPLVSGSPGDAAERRLIEEGRLLRDVPITVPPGTTVAVMGRPLLARCFAQAVGVSAARATGLLDPPRLLAEPASSAADVVVRVDSATTAVVVAAGGAAAGLAGRIFTPTLLTEAAFLAVQRALADGGTVPALDGMLAAPAATSGLAARFAVDDAGEPLDLDLVADGPHAVIGGTTGSGKSALLTAWVLALAAAHPPHAVSLLLVDCKGGAAFDALAALPHVVGVVTDLDGEQTARAVESLRAELRRREGVLRSGGHADLAGSGEGRLVIVVDEFRVLLADRPALAAVFVDLAARGRSLGVHLVLCTQRPAGSLRDELMTNCALRICLRVNDPADSSTVVGTDAAAALPRDAVGAAVLALPGERPRRMRVAAVHPSAVSSAVAGLARLGGRPFRRPWLDPLPAVLPFGDLSPAAPGTATLGRLDLPARQAQPPLVWPHASRPRLAVIGDPGSGRTTTLALVAAQLGAEECSLDPATAWDRLHDDGAPLLVDDLEHLVDRLGGHGPAALDRLAARLRRPDAAPTVLALRGPGAWTGTAIRQVVALVDEVLLLRLGLDDHLGAGGRRDRWSERLAPGGGWWHGDRAQVALPERPLPRIRPVRAPVLSSGPALLLSSRPADREPQLVAAGWAALAAGAEPPESGPALVCGTPAAWQAHWAAFGRLAQTLPVLVDRVDPVDVRTLLGRSVVLLPVTDPDEVVLIRPQADPERVRLPGVSGR
ncbi:MAG: segregation ATPase FtsK/SpoIIIE, family, partial [Microbacteriaceae bacterium]|nr:segregation ATPase FtsK/SpoIIIE, family [Microbacteriaceae bacterium]